LDRVQFRFGNRRAIVEMRGDDCGLRQRIGLQTVFARGILPRHVNCVIAQMETLVEHAIELIGGNYGYSIT
jgi:hypothetical protein